MTHSCLHLAWVAITETTSGHPYSISPRDDHPKTCDCKRKAQGKCEGRKSYCELKPEVLKELKRLHRKPRNGRRLTAEKMNASGFRAADGKPFTGNNVSTILHRQKN